ncbi:JAB domain-containing protein [Halopseudomonas pelagia]
MILSHNHPRGNPEPSVTDRAILPDQGGTEARRCSLARSRHHRR